MKKLTLYREECNRKAMNQEPDVPVEIRRYLKFIICRLSECSE